MPDQEVSSPSPELRQALLEHALLLAKQGLATFPARVWWNENASPPKWEKPPAFRHSGRECVGGCGYKHASCHEPDIRAMWAECPDANALALPMRDNGLVALDVDPRNLVGEVPEVPATWSQSTISQGMHHIFLDPGGQLPGKFNGDPGLDIKSNGYIIIAPTGGYERTDLSPPAPWPFARSGTSQGASGKGSGSSSSGQYKPLSFEEELRGIPLGQRHDKLFARASELRGRPGMTKEEAYIHLIGVAALCGVSAQEAKGFIDDVWRKYPAPDPVASFLLQVPGARSVSRATSVAAPPETHLPEEFWEARPVLRHIRQAAWSRQRSADTVLHAVLARVAAFSSHKILLPPIVGSEVPACYFAVSLASSGVGKSSGSKVAKQLLLAPDSREYLDSLPLGSGEGLVEMFFETVDDPDFTGRGRAPQIRRQFAHNAYVFVDEGLIIGELGSRKGSVLLPTLRSIWTGGTLGQTNASTDRRRVLEEGTYAYGVTLSLLVEKAGALLDDADAGTPQRFGWCLAWDPNIPDEPPEWPGELLWTPPEVVPVPQGNLTRWSTYTVAVAEEIKAEIRGRDLERARTGKVENPLDSHADLYRLKVALLLALLSGRDAVEKRDWELAGIVRNASNATREFAQATVAQLRATEEKRATGKAAKRQVEVDAARETRRIVECAQKLAKKVWATEAEQTRRGLLMEMRRHRDVFDDGLDHAVAEGWVTVAEVPSHTSEPKKVIQRGESRPR